MKNNSYWYKFFKQKKIDKNTVIMAHVKVWDIKGKEIGCEIVWTGDTPEKVVDMIVRDYEISKIWNSKEFSFNRKNSINGKDSKANRSMVQ